VIRRAVSAELAAHLAVDTLPLACSGAVRIRADALPTSTHGSNLRSIFSLTLWQRLAIAACGAAGNRCEVCGAVSASRRPHAHERWIFERVGDQWVQRLDRLAALCPTCHLVQHVGLAGVIGYTHDVIRQLMDLNGWTEVQARADIARAAERLAALDTLAFDLDITALRGIVPFPQFPDYVVPADRRGSVQRVMLRPRRAPVVVEPSPVLRTDGKRCECGALVERAHHRATLCNACRASGPRRSRRKRAAIRLPADGPSDIKRKARTE
jgi:hypothetical protein